MCLRRGARKLGGTTSTTGVEDSEEKNKEKKEKELKKTHSAQARRLPGSPRTKGCLIECFCFVLIGEREKARPS